jgi:SNF2 family DNA or RNA helicase
MMEPDYDFGRQVQAYARVHRIGQKNPKSYSYRLIDAGSDIEERILKRQRDRSEVFGTLVNKHEADGGRIVEEEEV